MVVNLPKLQTCTRTKLVPYEHLRRALDVGMEDLHVSFYLAVKCLEIDKMRSGFFSLMFFFVHKTDVY